MDVLQGRYLKKITSKRGKLKGLQLETDDGVQSIYLPKSLRTIAQQELDSGDELRVWSTRGKKDLGDQGKKNGKKATSQTLWAVQIIPLSPKAEVAKQSVEVELGGRLESQLEVEPEGEPGKRAAKKLEKRPKGKLVKGKSEEEKQLKKEKSVKEKSEKRSAKGSGKKKKRKAKLVTVQLCQKKNCCKRGGTQLWQSFEQVSQNSPSAPFKLEAVGCLGGCKRGPNIRFLPDNVKHYHVQPDDVSSLLERHRG